MRLTQTYFGTISYRREGRPQTAGKRVRGESQTALRDLACTPDPAKPNDRTGLAGGLLRGAPTAASPRAAKRMLGPRDSPFRER